MLDRSIAPLAGEIAYSPLQKAIEDKLDNHIPLYMINAGVQPVFKLELVLSSGAWYESKRALSWFTAKMLLEGSKRRSGKEISEAIDSLGAFIEVSPGFDDVSIEIYGVNKTFDQVLELFREILLEPTFPADSLATLQSIRKDQLKVNDGKNDMLASKKMREALYGVAHPYGYGLKASDIDCIDLEDVVGYYHNDLFNQAKLYLSGKIDDQMITQVKQQFVTLPNQTKDSLSFDTIGQSEIYVERKESLQSSLRMAWHIPDKGAEGYFDYLLTNTFLGGYFGSRLMKNIREEKGYTYGISSYPLHLNHGSFAVISTDIKAEHTLDTLSEIKKELDLLKFKGVDADEIETVSNYLAGSFLSSIDTPFQLMKMFKKINDHGLTYDYYEQYFRALQQVNSEQIQQGIEKYFDMDAVHVSIVGIKK
ncbi:insulinase family protein [Reichenbachiella agarivorans]|uniref:Insulinase family protein n=1 Tax=Reichenbachiella agarivorans TaxID=2979464 RepID=A0ABY6CRV7_9BACT|nr:pitrilysin family protein [Reichenbachiella agarivorans]UXP33249.1 insulinase family protein [Reichenbachiella agarivorans]